MYHKGDFHLHSNASDGKYTSTDVVNIAASKNIDILSITDHDTTVGVSAAISTGKDLNIKVIPGIELSTSHNGETVHILGYFNNSSYMNDSFQSFLKEMNEFRVYRGEKIVNNLKKFFDIDINYKNIVDNASGIIARPLIAKAIIEKGYPYSWDEVFKELIGKDSPAYVPNKQLTTSDGIKLLKKNNALVVLAHPVLIKKFDVSELLSLDLDGIEAIYPLNTKEQTKNFKRLAIKYNKIITAGSDFHGISKGDGSHGEIGCVYLTKDFIKAFLEKLNGYSLPNHM